MGIDVLHFPFPLVEKKKTITFGRISLSFSLLSLLFFFFIYHENPVWFLNMLFHLISRFNPKSWFSKSHSSRICLSLFVLKFSFLEFEIQQLQNHLVKDDIIKADHIRSKVNLPAVFRGHVERSDVCSSSFWKRSHYLVIAFMKLLVRIWRLSRRCWIFASQMLTFELQTSCVYSFGS